MNNNLFGIIYKTVVLEKTSRFYNKIYIGKRLCNVIEDFTKSNYFGSGKIIQRVVAKYGIKSIKTEPIYLIFDNDITTDREKHKQLGEWEKHFIKLYNSRNPEIGINLVEGGYGGIAGYKFTKKQKKEQSRRLKKVASKISGTLKNYYKTHENKNLGTVRTKITKQKQSEAANKRWSNPEERKKKSKFNINYYKTQKGQTQINNIRNTLIGRKDSEDTKRKKSEAQLKRNYTNVIRDFKLICHRCGNSFIGTSGNQKWCKQCQKT